MLSDMGMMINRRRVMGGKKGLLPSGYKQLEYIENTGTQYLQGNISGLTDSAEIIIDVYSYKYSCDAGLFSLYNSTLSGTAFYAGYGFWNAIYAASYTNMEFEYIPKTAVTGNHTIERKSNGDIYIDGSKTTNTASIIPIIYEGMEQPYTKMEPFANMTSFIVGNIIKISSHMPILPARYKRITIKNKLDLVPARRNSDNVLGMYDLVNNIFYTNAGAGTFIAGPEV